MQSAKKNDILLYTVIALSLISAVYWSAYAINNYNTFHEYEALDYYAYNMYYDVAYPNIMGGIQLLVSGTHVAPDQLFVLLFFYLVQSPLTLLTIQAVVLSFTAVVVFFIGRDILKSDRWGLVLSIAYLINPGMHGLLLVDYHAEVLMIPLYLLVFYYYMKLDKRMFYISTLLLLGTIDVAVFLTLAFGIGLYIFELIDKREGWSKRMALSKNMIALAIVVLLCYNIVYYSLQSCYVSSCASVPQFLQLAPWPGVPLFSSQLSYRDLSYSNVLQTVMQNIITGQTAAADLNFIVLFGVFIAFFSLGFETIVELPYLIVSLLPWLVSVLLLGFEDYADISRQYFAYVIGATVVAAVLGLMKLMGRKRGGALIKKREALGAFLASSTIVIALIVFVISIFVYIPGTDWGPLQIYAFQVPLAQQQNYAQLNNIISLVPANASLMTQETIFPHVLRKNLELLEYPPQSFVPQYILIDTNRDFMPPYMNNITAYFNAYTMNRSYVLYAQNGTAKLYREG